jgi:hypothetical protein
MAIQEVRQGTLRPSFSWHPSSNPADRKRIQPKSLLHYCRNVHSQRGDDGIIAEIFRRIGISKGFFVEFGAWDGIYLANSRALVDAGWSGAFIEGDKRKFLSLQKNYESHQEIICINEWVGTPGSQGGTIDQIAAEYFPDRAIDFMSIDIDGLDYLILETMEMRPKVISLEGGFAWHPLFTKRVPDYIAKRNLSQPLAVLLSIGCAAGYIPVAFNQNVYFVINELSGPFSGIRNNAITLWRDAWFNESDAFRSDLLRFHSRNPVIREIEGTRFVDLPVGRGRFLPPWLRKLARAMERRLMSN